MAPQYQKHQTLEQVQRAANARGLISKRRPGGAARMRGGKPLERGHIHHILSNPIYAGKIRHKARVFDGQHPAIMDPTDWQAVQDLMASEAARVKGSTTGAMPSPLIGKLFDETGDHLTPSHAKMRGKRLRYYVSRRLVTGNRKDHPDGWRLSAPEVERAICAVVRGTLGRPGYILDLIKDVHATDIAGLETLLTDCAQLFANDASPSHWAGFVARVDIAPGAITIGLNAIALAQALGIQPNRLNDNKLAFEAGFKLRRKKVETRIVLEGTAPDVDQTLIQNTAIAIDSFEALKSGTPIAEIAASHNTSKERIQKLMRLAFLSPRMVLDILAGAEPAKMTTDSILKSGLPVDWQKQASTFVG